MQLYHSETYLINSDHMLYVSLYVVLTDLIVKPDLKIGSLSKVLSFKQSLNKLFKACFIDIASVSNSQAHIVSFFVIHISFNGKIYFFKSTRII